MGYVQQLDNYEPNEVASICHKSDLFEEAFFVYKKHDKCKEAINVLMVDIVDLDRAQVPLCFSLSFSPSRFDLKQSGNAHHSFITGVRRPRGHWRGALYAG